MAERKMNLPETKGVFQVSGHVTGTEKDKFFESKTTKTNKPMNLINFGVETSPNSTVYVALNGMEKDKVYFYKKSEEKGKPGVTKEVKWANRNNFKEEGFKLLGVNVGVTRKMNDKMQEINDTKTLTEYDACELIANNLKDDQNVFVKGNIEFSSYIVKKDNEENVSRNVKFVPNQVSLCKPIDFEAEDFVETSDFQQHLIFMSAALDDSNKEDIKGVISAKIVTYSTIEEADFIIRDKALFSLFKKNLKPYTSIKVWGKINNKVESEETDSADAWGEENKFDKVKRTYIRELVITGADPKSIDKETYSEDKIEEAMRALREFGEKPSNSNDVPWGSDSSLEDEDNGWG